MTNRSILGIDTSNYKTSVAIVDEKQNIVCDLRRFLKVKQGEKGLRQSDALFQHIKNMPELLEEAMDSFHGHLEAIAYSSRPRPVEGSYMPVFLAGESFARSLGATLHLPVFDFSHQEGHIEAIRAYSGFCFEKQFLACHFSGGTSEILQVTAKGSGPETGYDIEIVGGSKDIAFGQVIDRAGVALGMAFPAGEEMDRIALSTKETAGVLTAVRAKDGWLNLSGIDTQMKRLLEEKDAGYHSQGRDMLIRELFEKLADAMAKMILQSTDKTGLDKVLMAGGVTSSIMMRDRLSSILTDAGICIEFGKNDLAQDNAAGTALLGGKRIWR